jgi:predicted Zn-dependent protease
MGKLIAQSFITIGIFFGMWWGLTQVGWMERFQVQRLTREKQEQLAELMLKLHKAEKAEVKQDAILEKVNNIKLAICERNYLDTGDIELHVFNDDVVNAFAMPGGHIVINTGLIAQCDNPDMLAGVMSHEMAHVYFDHVSLALKREIGMSTLLMLTGGSEHLGTLKELLHTLSSRSMDRDMEREADKRAIVYMRNIKGDPRQLAYFLRKLSKSHSEMPEVFKWVSTHPETKERVEYILEAASVEGETEKIMPDEDWADLKAAVAELR